VPGSSPEDAIRRLGELSDDVRAAVLLEPSGALAAHFGAEGERLRELAADLLARADRADSQPVDEVEVTAGGGAVFAVRRSGWTLAVVAGRLALASLMRYDLRQVLGSLGSEAA
jgi:hypothetical protein